MFDLPTLMDIPKHPSEIESMNDADFLNLVQHSSEINPLNRSVKYFSSDYYNALTEDQKKRVRQIMAPGLMSTDSKIGIYVRNPEDYETFREWIGAIVNDYHNTDISQVSHKSDWDLKDSSFDLADIDPALSNVSMRIRFAAIPAGFNLPAEQGREERIEFENTMVSIFEKMDGRYYSLTPGSEYEITREEYDQLVESHYMFKDMTEDPHLKVSDLSRDWPFGRGMFMKDIAGTQFKLIVWVGEEDLLRVMCMGYGSDMAEVFEQLNEFRTTLLENGLELAEDPIIGNPTSCPSNIGTSMRMSILLDTTELVEEGIDMETLKGMAKPLGLQVRGLDGETSTKVTPTYDLSPSARFGITQSGMLEKFYGSLGELVKSLSPEREI